MERLWVPHEELVFAPCTLENQGGPDAIFKDPDGNQVTYPSNKVASLNKVQEAQLVGVDNICTLEEVNEGAVLHAVRMRYARQLIYTRVAKILIAVNPFKALPIFSPQHLEKYMRGSDSADLPPHIYGIGLDAVMGLKTGDGKNQAVFISGESGAGKTESTKLVLSYVAEALGGADGGIQDRILRTNPILESFGNAMTVRNNNSSRFGKWLQIMVTPSMKIKGCAVVDYLLELTRVCGQAEKERNYHIFFMLMACKKDPLLSKLAIGEPGDYTYTKHAQFIAPGIDDKKFFDELKDALEGLGYSNEQQTDIYSLVMGILALGNVEFVDKGDAADIADESKVADAATFLGLADPEALKNPLLTRKITVGKDVTYAKRTAAQAKAARDSLSRLMYGRLFSWFIAGINQKLSGGCALDGQFFGVLDIAGFESFEVNSLEQLFINLGNEHLQMFFNNHIFKMELDDYEKEGIPVDASLQYQDNSDVVTLLDSKGAILAILDEEVSMPKASDQTFFSKVLKAHDKHPRMVAPKFAGAMKFGVRHFAGEVTYTVEGFLEKNVDKPPDEAPTLFQASKLSCLSEIGNKIASELAEGGGKSKKVKTVSSNFRSSMAALMEMVNTAEPHFIRCVKPNKEKVPEKFTSTLTMEQLRSSGVFEAVRIRQSGYAARTPFKDFLGRYRLLAPKAQQAELDKAMKDTATPEQLRAATEALVKILPQALKGVGGLDEGSMAMGKSKLFAKVQASSTMDRAREMKLTGIVVWAQAKYRGFHTRLKMRSVKVSFQKLDEWINTNKLYSAAGSEHTALAKYKTVPKIEAAIAEVTALVKAAADVPLKYPRMDKVQQARTRMENEVNCLKQLKELTNSLEPVEIDAALKRAKTLDLEGGDVLGALEVRVKKLKVQVPLVNAMRKAIQTKSLPMLQEVMEKIHKEGLHKKPEDWVEELKGESVAGEVFNLLEELKAKQKLDDIEKKRKEDQQKNLEAQVKQNEVKFEEDLKMKEEQEAAEKAAKKKRKATITGFSEEQQDKLKIGLIASCHEFDAAALEEGLSTATAQGMEENDQLKEAQQMFDNLQTESFLIAKLEECSEQVKMKQETVHAVKCIRNLAEQADKLGVAKEAAASAREKMRDQVRLRARKTMRADILFKVDVNEMELVEDAFSDLNKYPGLKTADKWRGHRSGYFSTTGSDIESRLTHSRNDLLDAITDLPPALEKRAVGVFHSILGWMSDRPIADSMRPGYASDIIDEAKSDRSLGDETYVQLMKQLNNNPSKRSELEGWQLMLQMCQQVRPGSKLDDFLHAFLLMSARDNDDEEIVRIARQCVADLNIITSPDKVMEDAEELMPVQVHLIDFTSRKLFVPKSCTLEQLSERMAQQLRIGSAKDFCLFQVTEGLEMHRLLPDNVSVSMLHQKWNTLKKSTGKQASLLYKRKLMQVTECLQPTDLMHATLTFRQAVWDYLHYPIPEDPAFIVDIAAHIMEFEHDFFKPYIDSSQLHNEGVLSKLVPAVSLQNERRASKWAQQIFKRFSCMDSANKDDTKLQKMSRIFSSLQNMKLFGAFYWMGKQQMNLPADRVSIEDAPAQMMKLNAKAPEGEYWICVDLFGVRFVSADSTPGKGFQRGFLFNDEALERLLCWGAKQDYAQFVVMTMNPAYPGAGRVPMTVAIKSPAAMDISYAIHTVLMHLGMLPQ